MIILECKLTKFYLKIFFKIYCKSSFPISKKYSLKINKVYFKINFQHDFYGTLEFI